MLSYFSLFSLIFLCGTFSSCNDHELCEERYVLLILVMNSHCCERFSDINISRPRVQFTKKAAEGEKQSFLENQQEKIERKQCLESILGNRSVAVGLAVNLMKQPQMTDALRRNELCVESRGVIKPRKKKTSISLISNFFTTFQTLLDGRFFSLFEKLACNIFFFLVSHKIRIFIFTSCPFNQFKYIFSIFVYQILNSYLLLV